MEPERIEPGPGQESVWDYPRPPRAEKTEKLIRVEWHGELVAETRRAIRVLETAGAPVYYIPAADVRTDFLTQTGKRTFCEWKGWATYFDVHVNGKTAWAAAWSYPNPNPGYGAIRDGFAFYAQKMERCTVDGELVVPQAGGFYGGWVTKDIVGPIKGEPGSELW